MRAVFALMLAPVGAVPAAAPSAQDERVYAAYLDFQDLVRGGQVQAAWLPDGRSFWYAIGGPNERQVLRVDAENGKAVPFFDVTRLRIALTKALGFEPAGLGVPFDSFQVLSPESVQFQLEGRTLQLDLTDYSIEKPLPATTLSLGPVLSDADRLRAGTFLQEKFQGLGKLAQPEALSPDGRWFAGIRDNDVVLRATVDGQPVSVTDNGKDEQFWSMETALSDPWSPDSQKLAALLQDASGIPTIPTIKWLKPLEQVLEVRTIRAGARLYRSQLHILDVIGRRHLAVDLGDTTDHYLRVLQWLPDSSELLVLKLDRLLSRVEMLAVDGVNGAVRPILREQSDTFLGNHHEILWGPETGFFLLPDAGGFLWKSERDGWDQLYHYDLQGRLIRRLTVGEFPVEEVKSVDLKTGHVYFTARADQKRPYDLHLYRVGLNGRGLTQLTEGRGQHDPSISPGMQSFVDVYSAVDLPPRSELRKTDGTLIRVLETADIGPLEALGWTPPQEHVVKAGDGETDLWVTMFLPYDFDPGQKYPVVEYIYAGPQTTWRSMDFGVSQSGAWMLPELRRSGNFPRALAQLGFVVLTLDGRGTPDRSKAFHDVVYRNWGRFEIGDHAGAIRQLAARFEFLDLDRVGIFGTSWGGHFAFRALTEAPDLYKAGISQAPGYSPHHGILYEPYLGMPQQNKAVYETADPFDLAPQLRGKLLLIGGMNDTGTQADLFKMSETLIRLGREHEVMVYPDSGHSPIGATAEYDMALKKRFLVEHVLSPP